MDRKICTNVETLDGLADELKALGIESAERVIPWTLSTETVDRDGDVILQAGWNLDQYRANPIILWAHDPKGARPGETVIGRSLSTYTDEKRGKPRLRALVQFTSQDENPDGYRVYRLASAGFLKASSVGFRALDTDVNAGGTGFLIKSAELMEASIVPIPANPQALNDIKAVDAEDRKFLKTWASRILDATDRVASEDLVARITQLEAAVKSLALTVPAALEPQPIKIPKESPEIPEVIKDNPVSDTGIVSAVYALAAEWRIK